MAVGKFNNNKKNKRSAPKSKWYLKGVFNGISYKELKVLQTFPGTKLMHLLTKLTQRKYDFPSINRMQV